MKKIETAFTMAERVAEQHPYLGLLAHGQGFTMAEILISLTIIGIIAAITLPSLMANINEKTWVTQRKALYSRMSQAISMMDSLNGYGPLTADETVATTNTVAERFITEGLSKVLKINNICNHNNLGDCGISSKIKTMDGSKRDFPQDLTSVYARWRNTDTTHVGQSGITFSTYNTMTAAFETANGESVAVVYTPNCLPDQKPTVAHQFYGYVCANFMYDLNGKKGPNTYGKDIGSMTVFYPFDSEIVTAMPYKKNKVHVSQIAGKEYCRNLNDGFRLPNLLEADSLVLNSKYISNHIVDNYLVTSTDFDADYYWYVAVYSGNGHLYTKTETNSTFKAVCIKR